MSRFTPQGVDHRHRTFVGPTYGLRNHEALHISMPPDGETDLSVNNELDTLGLELNIIIKNYC